MVGYTNSALMHPSSFDLFTGYVAMSDAVSRDCNHEITVAESIYRGWFCLKRVIHASATPKENKELSFHSHYPMTLTHPGLECILGRQRRFQRERTGTKNTLWSCVSYTSRSGRKRTIRIGFTPFMPSCCSSIEPEQ
jgi:hypothetical protein